MTDLQIAFEAIKAKQELQDKLFNYYNGVQPAVYSAKRLKDVFKGIDTVFSENWCAVVVDAVLDRLEIDTIAGETKQETALINNVWADRRMADEADDVHKAALVTGEAFVIVWPDADGNGEAFYNDPRKCHAQLDAENPKKLSWAAKMWRMPDKSWRMNLYYPDRIEKFVTRPTGDKSFPADINAFMPLEVIDNPYGILPVFYYSGASELTNILSPQIAINKLLNDMMIASEYGALKQRYVVSEAEAGNLKNAPNEIWWLPEGSQAGEFSETQLSNFTEAMDREANVISTISKTPKHYFLNSGGNVSGEALIVQEAPLNKKTAKYISRFTSFWRDVINFMLVIDGTNIDKADIVPLFTAPETVQPRTGAEITEIEVRSGIPLVTSLRRAGWMPAEIEQMQKDQKDEQLARAEIAQAYMEQARLNANQETE